MKRLLIVISILFSGLLVVMYFGQKRSTYEEMYVLPQHKSYVYSNDRKMSFEIYSENKDSLIKYPEKNQYNLLFDNNIMILSNVTVDVVKQQNIYVYIIEADIFEISEEVFIKQNVILNIINTSYSLNLDIGSIAILNPKTYKLLSVNDLYASYSYINGSLELVGINVKFSDIHKKINNISIGSYAYANLKLASPYGLNNEIDILQSIPNYNILNKYEKYSILLDNNNTYFIPICYPKLLTITQGYILFEIDDSKFYFDTFSFIVNKLEYQEYKDKMVKVEISYD